MAYSAAPAGNATHVSERDGDLTRHTFRWWSNASGDMVDIANVPIFGRIEKIVSQCSSGGPNYSVYLRDEAWGDALDGRGATFTGTAAEERMVYHTVNTSTYVPAYTAGTHKLVIDAAAQCDGVTVIYTRDERDSGLN